MKKNILCSVCGEQLVPYHRDKRMGFCKNGCNVFRCGWCGGIIAVSWTYYRAGSIWDWLVPKKILESVFYSSTAYCWTCGRRYPSKSNIIKYLFWEMKVLWWKLKRKKKEIEKSPKCVPKLA